MKRMIGLTILACLFALSALAAPRAYDIGNPLALPMEALDNPEGYASTVFRITAPNGQSLYVVSVMERPVVHGLDVNFDGAEDLAVMVSSGASNEVYRLFIRQGEEYLPVYDSTEEGLFNPAFYPDARLVGSHGSSGYAGALHEDILLRWEGSRLIPVRRAVCESRQEMVDDEQGYTMKTWYQLLHARVYAYDRDGLGEDHLLYEEIYDMEAQGMEDGYTAFYRREQDALWEGLEN